MTRVGDTTAPPGLPQQREAGPTPPHVRLITDVQAVLDALGAAVLIYGTDGRLAMVNVAAARMLGLPEGGTGPYDFTGAAPDAPPGELVAPPDTVAATAAEDAEWPVGRARREAREASGTVRLRCADGAVRQLHVVARPATSAGHDGVVCVLQDARADDGAGSAGRAGQRRLRELAVEAERLAQLDALTGLGNRSALGSRLTQLLADGSPVVLVTVALERFAQLCDQVGRGTAEAVVAATGRRLQDAVRAEDTVARIAADEFAVVVPGSSDPALARLVGERLRSVVAAPVTLADPPEVIELESSAGVAVAAGRAHSAAGASAAADAEELVREAGIALHSARERGGGRLEVFDRVLRAQALQRRDAERRLRRALAEGRLRLEYQPVVDLGSGRVVGAEALLRIDDPDQGVLLPGVFIDVAEDTGLISEVDAWVLDEAVRQAAAWALGAGGGPLRAASRGVGAGHWGPAGHLSVNVSARSLLHPGFVEQVAEKVRGTGLPQGWLHLEVTERTLLDASERTRSALGSLTATGIRVGIDDFGTGYSALAYLRRFDLDFIKLDRSFVADLSDTDIRSTALAGAVVDLAHALDLTVVAEGIETPEQLRILRRLGCEQAQGFLFARSLRPDVLERMARCGPLFPPA
ncbi:MAG: diguanylate cyclase/phosphodiesterase [Mycobacterium sp.]|nr:diguanylate cyclase/phosphodiesterase [Mycobacterium sp.]